MEITGKVLRMLPERTGQSQRGDWHSQDVVFEYTQEGQQYPRKVVVTFFNKKEDLAKLSEGVQCKVAFDIDAHEWNGRWFSDIRAWRLEVLNSAAPVEQAPQSYAAQPAAQPVAPMADPLAEPQGEPDDIPF